ncbi:SpoOJ or ParA or ParB or repB family protein [Saccharothrix sp. ST-888]|nr:SpoOJ or ParA or ParB or repB family protein [Saccharothrix sp. ST-888]
MSLSPFRGLRYVPDRVGTLAAVTSPPYDVVDPNRRLDLETADPYNIVRLILPRPEPEDSGDRPDRDTRYRHAARLLTDWQRQGVLAADPEPALYVYEQRTGEGGPGGGNLQRGLIGALAVSGREAGVVLPHEDVMPRPVADRVGLMRTTRANLEPLLLTYRGNGGAAGVIERAVLGEPLLTTTTSDGTHHRLWAVTDHAELAEVGRDLATCRALIADGHHRWEMYLRLQREHRHLPRSPWDRGMVLLVDTARYPLQVRAIHRVLYRLPVAEALARLGEHWQVKEVPGPLETALQALGDAKQHGGNAFLLTGGDGIFRLVSEPDEALLAATVPTGRPEEWRHLDATVLHATLLDHTWRVPDGPDDIGYLHAADAAEREAARSGGTAVLLHPVKESVVRRLAEQGVTMPRKSTSFGPKPATGLVLRSLTLG